MNDSEWQKVPDPVRSNIDRVHAPLLAQATEELRVASLAVDKARAELDRHGKRRVAAPDATANATRPKRDYGDVGEAWLAAARAHEKAQTDALKQVSEKQRAWLRGVVTWRERWRAAAQARVTMLRAGLELAKAEAVHGYTSTGGDADEEDLDRYRGQFARLQATWSDARRRADLARTDAAQLSRTVAEAKENYARLCRQHPDARPAAIIAAEAKLYSPHRVPHVW